jgi:predicted DNA-binding WGR domain protein
MKHYLTFKDDKSDKFWQIETYGKFFTVTYGKTGSAGTSQTKTFAEESECAKEAEKLMNEKLKKGYTPIANAKSEDYRETWKKITSTADVSMAFYNHFEKLLETEAERQYLKTLSLVIVGAKIEKDQLVFRFKSKYKTEEERYCSIYCKAPFDGRPATTVPLSFLKTSQLHNGIGFNSYAGGDIGFYGIDKDGKIKQNGGWEPEFLEDGDYDELLEKLEEKDLSIEDVVAVMGSGQNWILFDPFRKTTHKEPAYLFLDHEGEPAQPIKKAKTMKFGAFLIGVLCTSITSECVFDEISN